MMATLHIPHCEGLYIQALCLPPPLPLAHMLPLWGSVVSISEHELWAPQPCLQALLLHSLYEHEQVTRCSGCSCLVCRMGNDSSASNIDTVVGTEMMAIKPLTQHLAHRTYPISVIPLQTLHGRRAGTEMRSLELTVQDSMLAGGIFIQAHSAQHWDELMLQIPSVQHSFTPFFSFSFAAILPQPNPGSFRPRNQRELGSDPHLLTKCVALTKLLNISEPGFFICNYKDSMRQCMQHA